MRERNSPTIKNVYNFERKTNFRCKTSQFVNILLVGNPAHARNIHTLYDVSDAIVTFTRSSASRACRSNHLITSSRSDVDPNPNSAPEIIAFARDDTRGDETGRARKRAIVSCSAPSTAHPFQHCQLITLTLVGGTILFTDAATVTSLA